MTLGIKKTETQTIGKKAIEVPLKGLKRRPHKETQHQFDRKLKKLFDFGK